jgi:hypothetical protein
MALLTTEMSELKRIKDAILKQEEANRKLA